MKMITGNWSGRITGTNNANVFVELQQDEAQLCGIARINDPNFGRAVYNLTGVVENDSITMDLSPDREFLEQTDKQEIYINNLPVTITIPSVEHGNVILNAKLIKNETNETIEGTWRSTIGTGGNVFLTNVKACYSEENINRKKIIKR